MNPLRRSTDTAELKEALEILRGIEFTTVVANKCPLCWGWEPKGSGETERHHNATCRLDAILKRNPA